MQHAMAQKHHAPNLIFLIFMAGPRVVFSGRMEAIFLSARYTMWLRVPRRIPDPGNDSAYFAVIGLFGPDLPAPELQFRGLLKHRLGS